MLKGHSVFVIELCPISFPFPLLSNVSHVGQNDADIVQCSPLNSLPGAFLVCQNKIKSNVPLKGEDMGKGWWMEDGGWGMGGWGMGDGRMLGRPRARPGPSNIQATQARTGKFQHINIFQLSRPCSLLVFTFQPLTSPRHTATPFTPFLFFFRFFNENLSNQTNFYRLVKSSRHDSLQVQLQFQLHKRI